MLTGVLVFCVPARSILYPLDLYNEAANRALHKLKARFLYDEIEAEVNLAFDQFLFKLSQNIYAHFRMRASSIYLNKEYKNQLEDLLAATDGRFDANRSHFDSILRQRHFQVHTLRERAREGESAGGKGGERAQGRERIREGARARGQAGERASG